MAAPKGNKHGVGYGRPSLYEGDKTDKMVFEFASKKPVIDSQIAEFLGIEVSTLNNWKNKHPSFMESLTKAKEIIDNEVVSALFKRAVGYKKKEIKAFCHEGCVVTEQIEVEVDPNPTAMIFWLKNRDPNRWKDKQDIEHSGESTIKIEKIEEEL